MKSRSLTSRVRELFSIRWLRPVMTAHEAGQVMARKAAEARQRADLTQAERRDALHARLRAERAAGLVGGKRTA
ncbi:hypothetical protein [Caulobacter hibisci]|uniref:Uncharacterized protein n=1 Tax=Caulobacter hibisci TaxID=2035993 RepID=A0ABS0SRV1_9CAUL|nr:hypothetical protein [Caulobacter hibisci]MBI1682355.1 hypothetical protein [Caulobacter hibisci]